MQPTGRHAQSRVAAVFARATCTVFMVRTSASLKVYFCTCAGHHSLNNVRRRRRRISNRSHERRTHRRSRDAVRVHDIECAHEAKPHESEECNMNECPTYAWISTEWTQCNARSCRVGQQYRQVSCVSDIGRPAPSELCRFVHST